MKNAAGKNDTGTKKRLGELLRGLLGLLRTEQKGLQAKDALSKLRSSVVMTSHESGSYESGSQRFDKIVRFGTIGLVKAGWLTKAKGIWTATDAGLAALDKFKDPLQFMQEIERLYRVWKHSQPESFEAEHAVDAEDEDESSPMDGGPADGTFEEAEEAAWETIRKFLRQVDPYEMQSMVGGLLKAMGYHLYFEAPPGPDGGIDIVAFSDPLGSKPPRIKVQVKREAGAMSPDQVRSFMSLIGDGEVGIFINVGGFSKTTHEEVRKQMTRHVTLIDDEGFFDLWVKHYGSLEDTYKKKMPIRPIYFLAPSN